MSCNSLYGGCHGLYRGCGCHSCIQARVRLNQLAVSDRISANTALVGTDGTAYTADAIRRFIILSAQNFTTTQVSGDTSTQGAGFFNRYEYTDTSSPFTFTISTADIQSASLVTNWNFEIKDKSGGAGANNITITTEGGQTIDGAASVQITANYGIVRLYSDGTNLYSR